MGEKYKQQRRRRRQTEDQSSMLKRIDILHIFALISFLICSIIQSIDTYFWNIVYWRYFAYHNLAWYGLWLFYAIGQTLCYLCFLNRSIMTFKHTEHALSHCFVAYIWVLLTLYLTIWSGLCLEGLFDGDRDRVFVIESALSIPLIIVDILITIPMTYCFVVRLYRVIVAQTVSSIHWSGDSISDELIVI